MPSSPGQNGGESKSNGNKTGNNSYKPSDLLISDEHPTQKPYFYEIEV